jgi:putative Mn2+ efflux pump MntP
MKSILFLEILLISISLGFDAFSVALASGAPGFTSRRAFRMSWHFGLFQFMMPIIGWGLGDMIASLIGKYAVWVVFCLLLVIGGKMIIEGVKAKPKKIPDLSRGWNLITLSIATSIDALGVGVGFGVLGYQILIPALIIGVTCGIMTVAGLYLGVRLYARLKHRTIILGGIILIAIGIKMLV